MFVPHVFETIEGSEGSSSSTSYVTEIPDRQATYNHWKSVVERYSKTKLTNPGDKLIALSGIARLMAGLLPRVEYVAGLWGEHLASQLLWRVDPVFEHGKFSFPSSRPAQYRAPSFSWAAVDAERGITYGDFTDENLLIKVMDHRVIQEKDADPYGLVKAGCTMELSGILKRIILERRVGEDGLIRYRWALAEGPGAAAVETYSNVYLDSPQDDKDILGPDGRVFCLPAMIPPIRGVTSQPDEPARKDDKGETAQSEGQTQKDDEGNAIQPERSARRNDEGYIICLLLQRDKTKWTQYRRIGLTKIPPYDQEGQRQVYDPNMSEEAREREKEVIFLV
jgi:hypothetical protein